MKPCWQSKLQKQNLQYYLLFQNVQYMQLHFLKLYVYASILKSKTMQLNPMKRLRFLGCFFPLTWASPDFENTLFSNLTLS